MDLGQLFLDFIEQSGIYQFFLDGGWRNLIMIGVACLFLFLAIKKKFEPYLLIPIAFGMLLANIPGSGVFVKEGIDASGNVITNSQGVLLDGYTLDQIVDYKYHGLIGTLYYGVKYELYPCLIFLGIGATTDFGPLIANKKTMLLGAAAQIGIFAAFLGGLWLFSGNPYIAGAIGIIGGADGPTAILVSN